MLNLEPMKILLIIFLIFCPLLYSQAQELSKDEARGYREKAYQFQSEGDLQSALMYYQKAGYLDSSSAAIANDIGVIYEALGNDDKALINYKNALEKDKNFLPVYTNLALIYERKGDIKNATLYWKKRYLAGEEGDYWWEISRQHLLKLGTYPEVRKAMLEDRAARLSRELIYTRDRKDEELVEKARILFDIGTKAFAEGDYESAIKQFRGVMSLNPPDGGLKDKANKLYQQSKRLFLKGSARANTNRALEFIDDGDYLSAGEELKEALSDVSRISK